MTRSKTTRTTNNKNSEFETEIDFIEELCLRENGADLLRKYIELCLIRAKLGMKWCGDPELLAERAQARLQDIIGATEEMIDNADEARASLSDQ